MSCRIQRSQKKNRTVMRVRKTQMFSRNAILTLFLLTVFFSQLFAIEFTIHGNIQGMNNDKVYLDYLDDKEKHIVDSALVLDGQFTITGHIETPTFGILYFSVSQLQETFFFEAGATEVTGDLSKSKSLNFSGHSSTRVFAAYRKIADSFSTYRSALIPFISGEQAIKDSALHSQYQDSYYLSLSDEENYTEQFIRKRPDSYLSAYLLYSKFSSENNINKGLALLNTLSPQIQHSKYIRQLQQLNSAIRLANTGMYAPDFSEPDSSGKSIRLSEIKTKYLLLDFWASWCAPCRRENPELVKAYQKFHDKGFEILSVSFDRNKQHWIDAMVKDGMGWLSVCDFKEWDDDKAARAYGVNQIPMNFLIDKNGIIIGKNLLGTGLDYELSRLLGVK